MRLHFLGGADEIGASCTLVEMDGHRVLVDAGIRMGASPGAHLPNFSALDEFGPPDEVLVTHAHTDHTGALPVLVAGLPPEVPIRMTAPTAVITRVLLGDALKIMEKRGERDGELPLYPPEAVDVCLSRITSVPTLSTLQICEGKLSATWIPAGHILGAASIYIEGQTEGLLMTGDVSVSEQQTIPGMIVPQCRPDVVVMESTYGDRQHADRSQQETSLALRVAEAVESGGKVLIPAFAVGRAQEVILILSGAMRDGLVQPFPLHVDGMVRSVNAVYAGFSDELAPRLRRRIQKGDDSFTSGFVTTVADHTDRDRILEGPPCCIVASSGMLIGGASSFYAERLSDQPENLIAITGYQDEESPGRALLALAKTKDKNRTLTLNGRRISVECSVETYSLSAHADGGQLAALARRLSPRSVHLVHGSPEARAALASTMDLHLPEGVHLPGNGTTSESAGQTAIGTLRYGHLVSVRGLLDGGAADNTTLDRARGYLIEAGTKGPFRVQDLAEVCYGTDRLHQVDLEAFRELLKGSQRSFSPDRRRPYLFHIAPDPGEGRTSGPMEMNQARDKIQDAFPPEAGLFKCSAFVEDQTYELAFHFPDVVSSHYGDRIQELESETGWKITLRKTPHQERLFQEARSAVPEGVSPTKPPALRLDERSVSVEVVVPRELEADWEGLAADASRSFEQTTGYRLMLRRPGAPASGTEVGAPEGALEINHAYAEIRSAFRQESHAPNRIGLKSGSDESYLEVSFISPAVGARYRKRLDALSSSIGWPIAVRESTHQEQISGEALKITPDACQAQGAPRLFVSEQKVVVHVLQTPEPDEQSALQQAFLEATGFQISWETR